MHHGLLLGSRDLLRFRVVDSISTFCFYRDALKERMKADHLNRLNKSSDDPQNEARQVIITCLVVLFVNWRTHFKCHVFKNSSKCDLFHHIEFFQIKINCGLCKIFCILS